jgi:hypothetical protein
MAAAIFAAVATFPVIRLRKNHKTVFEVIIFGYVILRLFLPL